ncbi:MAG: S9 family peptidase, partial [Betaproteobacteria bacterium]
MTDRRQFLSSVGAFAGVAALPSSAQEPRSALPPAKSVMASDDYYGTTIADPYRWMENTSDPDLLPWLKAQNAHARAVLDGIPGRAALGARISELSGELSITKKVRATDGRLFFEQQPAGAQNFKLFVRDDGRPARVLIDPTTLEIDGKHVSLDWWEPALSGRHVAYGLSAAGSEASTAHVMEVESGKILEARIPNTDFGITGWLPDGSGFLYIQFIGERGTPTFYWDSVVKLHLLGADPKEDWVVLRRGLYAQIPMKEVQVGVVRPVAGTDQAIVEVRDVRPERAVWTARLADLVAGQPRFRAVATDDDLVVDVAATGDDLFLITNRDRPRGRVLVTSIENPSLATATEVLPQSTLVTEAVHPIHGGALVRMMDGGVQRLMRVSHREPASSVPLPFEGSIRDVFSSPLRSDAYLALTGWLEPPAVWRWAPRQQLRNSGLDGRPPFDLSPYVADRRFAPARDGTQVPYTIIAKRGWKTDARNPVLATAYGAYQYSLSPAFNPRVLAFLDAGGVYVVANVRGGGEYGRDWHKAGQKATKPNTWRDFIDVSQALITSRVTSSGHLVILGTSAGGIAVGRALTEQPDLFAGAVADVGFMNPLRYSAEQNNLDIDEWGPIVDAASFRAMYEMDSYHAIRDGTRYPPVLVISGFNDPRVATFHAAKFVARLQEATKGKSAVLLRMDFEAGHGMGSTRKQRDALLADIY